jgi:septum formation protein
MTKTKLVLASTSPRRKQILEMLGLEFEVRAVEVDESIIAGESPYDYVHRLAITKAQAGSGHTKEIITKATTTGEIAEVTYELVIGGDVTIDRDGIALAKAESPAEARQMLASLSGKTHMVRDAFALTSGGAGYCELLSSGVTTSMVTFRDLSEADIDEYLSSGEWEGKAGAYAIQGKAADFITDIQGSFYDILGLPIYAVAAALISTHLPEFQGLAEKIKQIAARDKTLIASVLKRS